MTTEERFERIEHVTAGLAEERRKDREESRQWWRDTQRQLDQLADRVNGIAIQMDRFILEAAARDAETDSRFRETDRRFRETDERIDKLVSGIGEFLRKQAGPA
ncbi:MAG TPA: hypothetical protein VN924_28615 [Bryobacteraceae bacterium]|nr:hypothetical protein [Bryobacteraceae bacterium]